MDFSVLMSVYKNDKKEQVKEALDSVINQTVKPSEIILIEDGPVPEELEILIKQYEKDFEFIKVTRLEKNVGLGDALRIGIEKCNYNIVARMDSDDISVKNRFEKQLKEFENDSNLDLVGGIIEEFIESPKNSIDKREVPESDEDIKKYIKSRCPFNHMTVMYKKDKVLEAGNYKQWFYNEDYYLWIRMYLAGCKFKNIQETLVYARVDYDTYQRRGGMKYFKSEAGIQKYMLKNKVIGFWQYVYNVAIRFVLQILMPNKLRAFIFKKFARKGTN